jgi:hypothetical protein
VKQIEIEVLKEFGMGKFKNFLLPIFDAMRFKKLNNGGVKEPMRVAQVTM